MAEGVALLLHMLDISESNLSLITGHHDRFVVAGQYLTLGITCFLLHPFQFTII